MIERTSNAMTHDVEALKRSGRWCEKHKCERDVETDCHRCHGDGMIEDMDDVICGGMETCYACNGSGVGWPDCEWCIQEEDEYV